MVKWGGKKKKDITTIRPVVVGNHAIRVKGKDRRFYVDVVCGKHPDGRAAVYSLEITDPVRAYLAGEKDPDSPVPQPSTPRPKVR